MLLVVMIAVVLGRIFTLYAKALSLDIASRIWDVFFRDGEEFLFRTATGEIWTVVSIWCLLMCSVVVKHHTCNARECRFKALPVHYKQA